ncbi:hypothetical protein Nm8I071_24050 [Nonomuraea sp. TT08I-71]|nr:hypothetical protein Nm8I071_24050 [Nonomuraea sp. TT08I-71]
MSNLNPGSGAERGVDQMLSSYRDAAHLSYVPPPVDVVVRQTEHRVVRRLALATAAAVLATFTAGTLALTLAQERQPMPSTPAPALTSPAGPPSISPAGPPSISPADPPPTVPADPPPTIPANPPPTDAH